MKKILIVFLLLVFVLLSACADYVTDPAEKNDTIIKTTNLSVTDNDTVQTTENKTVVTTAQSTENTTQKNIQLPLPYENTDFIFHSGSGGWRTEMTVNRDGTFYGQYYDSEMGLVGDGYPKGSLYICDFTGKFVNVEKVNDYSYQLELSELKTQEPEGKEWIEDGIKHIASAPYGLYDSYDNTECEAFILYLPDTPVDVVPEEFLYWWPYRYEQDTAPKSTLSCYGILNLTTNDGFFFEE